MNRRCELSLATHYCAWYNDRRSSLVLVRYAKFQSNVSIAIVLCGDVRDGLGRGDCGYGILLDFDFLK